MKNNKPPDGIRLQRPERFQINFLSSLSLDQMLPHDDRARIVWKFVESLDLTPLYEKIQVAADTPGRPAIDPRVLVALWLMATVDGISFGRELARRCTRDIRYMWICGGVSVNYHTLSDFRVNNLEFLDKVLVDTVTSLIAQGLVPLETIAQDGVRVRANAGSGSFHRKPTLERLQQQVQEHVDRLKKEAEREAEAEAEKGKTKSQAAKERAACDLKNRLDEALRQYEELSRQREKRKKGDGEATRVSTTDPDARKMKMANGGYDPAYNIQFATDGDSRVIVGVDVTNEGSDAGEMPPMQQQVWDKYGQRPTYVLVDSAFATINSVTSVEKEGSKVLSSIIRSEQLIKHGKDPHSRQRRDTDEYENFRKRMADPENQERYKQRPSIAEFPNAHCRNHGLRLLPVRGLQKVKAIALWHAITFNLFRMLNLQASTA